MQYSKQRFKAEQGFTLVELAIVLMIIGLLISGILRGQELMNNAKITTTVQQVKAYQGAIVTFQDAYSQLPGDMITAQARLPNCNTANYCLNGDSNSILGTLKVGMSLMDLQSGTGTPGQETTMFWKHLAVAHLISGVLPNANPNNPIIGETHPTAKIGGGFMVMTGSHFPDSKTGLILVMTNRIAGSGSVYDPDGRNPVSPIQARQIDTKLDDGLADLGEVYAPDNGTCDNDVNGVRQYLNTEFKTCILAFNIQ